MRFDKFCLALIMASLATTAHADEPRSKAHAEYAASLWNYVTNSVDYKKWQESAPLEQLSFAPPTDSKAKSFLNAAARTQSKPRGSIVVTEHYGEDGEVQAITACVRARDGYHPVNKDWYWAHFLPDGTTIKTSVDKSAYAKRGFVTFEEDGRLWVFTTNSDQLAGFLKQGELAKHVIRPGAGPNGMTVKAPDAETLDAYVTSRPGFATKMADGRLWVFRVGSKELKEFTENGEPAKHVIRPAAGPDGITVKGPDAETIDAYLRVATR